MLELVTVRSLEGDESIVYLSHTKTLSHIRRLVSSIMIRCFLMVRGVMFYNVPECSLV